MIWAFYQSITEILKRGWGRRRNDFGPNLQGGSCDPQILNAADVLYKYYNWIYRHISSWKGNKILLNIWTLLHGNYLKYYICHSLSINLISLYLAVFLTVIEYCSACCNVFSSWKDVNDHFKCMYPAPPTMQLSWIGPLNSYALQVLKINLNTHELGINTDIHFTVWFHSSI